ncbi:MAG: glutamine synthetase III [Candidatus Omnitrophota bacterium]|nr:glutamine synthetase III [Candidatus Omnitrophota bacterium]
MDALTDLFGSNVFSNKVMKDRLPTATYDALQRTIKLGKPLTLDVANVVAKEMKNWALEKGATHYTHWFHPLTGITAEKHDSFIEPDGDGNVVAELSGKQLIQGEPDASSFPSGGIRATFEARGYTAWDATSPAFLKKDSAGNVTLCIPTAFCSWTGEALDKKTPLLRSMEAVSRQALRVLRALGNKTSNRVTATVGPEQEYFLVDKEYFDERLDLMLTGRTLFGAPAPKGQELEDQYFGAIKDRVSDFMRDLNTELWSMGVMSKTQHNEVAPAQYEMAPFFTTTNVAADHNQLVMETLQKVALRHKLVCLLHEKPYAGVNGSGKHNNWSMATDDGFNLLEPGSTPHDNEQFLLVLSALVMAVDKHADKLRASAANNGNDLRLGANEAPPAIVSIFMGAALTDILQSIAQGTKYAAKGATFLRIGVDSLPDLPMHNTDRNRTSPFAFTGNKFEFRMMPSSASISGANVVLNTIAAEALDYVATRLEKAGKKDVNKEAQKIVKDLINKHGRVIYDGDNYAASWVKEAKKRGLPNITNTVDSIKSMMSTEAEQLFSKYGVLSKTELHSRCEIYFEQYAKKANIEARASIDMVKKQYLPVVMAYAAELAENIKTLKAVSAPSAVQKNILTKISQHLIGASKSLAALEEATGKAHGAGDAEKCAKAYRDSVVPVQNALREDIDALEVLLPADLWPVPSYATMLFKL